MKHATCTLACCGDGVVNIGQLKLFVHKRVCAALLRTSRLRAQLLALCLRARKGAVVLWQGKSNKGLSHKKNNWQLKPFFNSSEGVGLDKAKPQSGAASNHQSCRS
eukprot:5240807-Amphidinium_carterae.1